ncbi:MAG: hypothetical protein MJ101_03780 [Clostridia bacterium]|nr:hypothetical protein [Clostridia bacterium]
MATNAELQAEIAELKKRLALTEQAAQPSSEEEKKAAEAEKYLNEEVTIRLFKDGEKYKVDLVLVLNGVTVVIKRGIPQRIKRKYANLIELAQIQDIVALDAIKKAEDTYKADNDRFI